MSINKNFLKPNPNALLCSLKLFSLIGYLTVSISAFADSPTIRASNNQIILRTNSTKIDYAESGNGLGGTNTAKLDTESGDVPGYAVLLSVMSDEDNNYFAAEYDKSDGQTTYTGAQQGGVFGSLVNTSTLDQTNFYFRLGKGFSSDIASGESMGTLFFEVGNHKWERGLSGTTPPSLDIYSNDYIVFGGLGQYSPAGSKLVLSANAMWGVTFSSSIKTSNGDVGTRGNPPTTRCGFSADYEFIKQLHGSLSVDIVSFSYVISSTYSAGASQVFSPNNSSNYTTIKLGLGYAF